MTEYSENSIKFGWLNKEEMLSAIQNGALSEYNICFTKDTHEEYIINSKLEPIPIKSRLRIYNSVDAAVKDINEDKTLTYVGEVLSIRNEDRFIAYVVNELDGEYFVTPVYADRMVDYDKINNIPIKNIIGTIDDKIVIADLEDGFYKVCGRFITPKGSEINSIVGNYIIVETLDIGKKSIKRINSTDIFIYTITNDEVISTKYATEKYIEEQGFCTKEYIDNTFAILESTMQEYIKDYVATTCTMLIREIINQELDNRYANEQDIKNLFT